MTFTDKLDALLQSTSHIDTLTRATTAIGIDRLVALQDAGVEVIDRIELGRLRGIEREARRTVERAAPNFTKRLAAALRGERTEET